MDADGRTLSDGRKGTGDARLTSCHRCSRPPQRNFIFSRGETSSTYESIAARFARLAVGDDDGLFDFAVDLKVFAQTGVRRVVRQAADKDFRERRVFDGRR